VIYFVTGLDGALSLAFWLVLAAGCFLLYRTFRLPVLPWVASYIVLAFLTAQVPAFYISRLTQSYGSQIDPRSGVTLAAMAASVIQDAGALLAAILLLAEVVVLATRSHPSGVPRGLHVLARAHAHTWSLGIVLIVLALVYPLPAIIYYYAH
jgi:hypothetical protein